MGDAVTWVVDSNDDTEWDAGSTHWDVENSIAKTYWDESQDTWVEQG